MNMCVRLCLILSLLTGFLWAQTEMNVEQLADFVRSELALKQHSDKQIANGVKQVKLIEKLTDKTIIDLQAQGAGPKTVEALRYLQQQAASLKPPAHDATSSPATAGGTEATAGTALEGPKPPPAPPPSEAKQREILQSIREYAMNYTKSLPNYFCVEVTRQFVDPNGAQSYRNAGTILAKLGYNDGQEKYNVYSINGKLVDTTMDAIKTGGATSTGEFYSLMKSIFEDKSEAEFHWDHWAKLRGRTMAIFNYFVDSGHSDWTLEDKSADQRIRTAFRGLVYADPMTGEIDRIKFEATNIPKSFPINSTTETLDYDLVSISGQQFVLPLAATLYMKAGRESSKNEIEFRAYRKFEADTFIKYNLDPNAPDPLPASKTEEKPATGTEQQKPEAAKPQPEPTQPGAPAAPAKPTKSPWLLPTLDDVPPPPPR